MPLLKYRRWGRQRGSLLLLLFCLLVVGSGTIKAQSNLPEVKNLLVELWPEYDRPEVLVIYRVELSPETSLPAQLTFRLPGRIETMHAVALEQDGALFQVTPDSFELRHDGDDLLFTLSSNSPKFQFEYYDAAILSQQGQTRRLTFNFSAPYQIEAATFEVQEPFQAEDFALVPQPSSSFVGSNGLKYNLVEVAGLAPAETVELSASYRRSIDELSAKSLGIGLAGPTTDPAAPGSTLAPNFTWGYLLLGVGLVLLLGAGLAWWWVERVKMGGPQPPPARRPGRRKKAGPAGKAQARPAAQSRLQFCFKCGTALRPEANFCHHCGTERRRE